MDWRAARIAMVCLATVLGASELCAAKGDPVSLRISAKQAHPAIRLQIAPARARLSVELPNRDNQAAWATGPRLPEPIASAHLAGSIGNGGSRTQAKYRTSANTAVAG